MKLLELAVVKPLKCRVLVENMFCSSGFCVSFWRIDQYHRDPIPDDVSNIYMYTLKR